MSEAMSWRYYILKLEKGIQVRRHNKKTTSCFTVNYVLCALWQGRHYSISNIQIIQGKHYTGRSVPSCKWVHRAYGDIEGPDQQHIHAVLSDHSLSANRIIGYYRLPEWTAKSRVIFCACAEWSETAYFCACLKARFHLARSVSYARTCINCALYL